MKSIIEEKEEKAHGTIVFDPIIQGLIPKGPGHGLFLALVFLLAVPIKNIIKLRPKFPPALSALTIKRANEAQKLMKYVAMAT